VWAQALGPCGGKKQALKGRCRFAGPIIAFYGIPVVFAASPLQGFCFRLSNPRVAAASQPAPWALLLRAFSAPEYFLP
jgi:hypothetical protein